MYVVLNRKCLSLILTWHDHTKFLVLLVYHAKPKPVISNNGYGGAIAIAEFEQIAIILQYTI